MWAGYCHPELPKHILNQLNDIAEKVIPKKTSTETNPHHDMLSKFLFYYVPIYFVIS
jgi:hypothetical protein